MSSPPFPIYEQFLRPLLFSLDPETTHQLAQFALRRGFPWSLLSPQPADERLACKMGDLSLRSPIGLAAGFDKNGTAIRGLQHLGFGYVTVGSVVLKPSGGHPRPRLLRYPETESLANCYGLPSDGLEACVKNLRKLSSQNLNTRLIVNIHAETVEDYAQCFTALAPFADGIELGLRCPNRSDHLSIYPVEELDTLMSTLRQLRPDKALFAKLPPYENEHEKQNRLELVERAIHFGLAGVTIPGNWNIKEPRLSRGQGSLTGRLTFENNLKTVEAIAGAAKGRIAIRASGGVHNGAEAFRLLAAGATAVDLLTAFIYRGWNTVTKMQAELLEQMEQNSIASIADLQR